jgi:hypothetical protein
MKPDLKDAMNRLYFELRSLSEYVFVMKDFKSEAFS